MQGRRWRGEKGLWIGSDFSSTFWGRKPNPAIPAGPEAGSTGRLPSAPCASGLSPPMGVISPGPRQVPEGHHGKRGKRRRVRPWAETLVKGYPSPPGKGPPRADTCRGIATKPWQAGRGWVPSSLPSGMAPLSLAELSRERGRAVVTNTLQISSMEEEKRQHDQKYAKDQL